MPIFAARSQHFFGACIRRRIPQCVADPKEVLMPRAKMLRVNHKRSAKSAFELFHEEFLLFFRCCGDDTIAEDRL